jgi:glucan 1,3-beta-glucosidase
MTLLSRTRLYVRLLWYQLLYSLLWQIFIRTSGTLSTKLTGSLVLDNIKLNNVNTLVYDSGLAKVVATGGTTTISQWAQGNVYTGNSGSRSYRQAAITGPSKPGSLLDSSGRFFGRAQPQYEGYAASQFVSVRANGAKGDGACHVNFTAVSH